jgi:NADH:ubiquinone oxidoreductase subunit 3 (subunit A)
MASPEFVLHVVVCLQPAAVGLAIVMGAGRWAAAVADKITAAASRSRQASLRFYECSTSGRLTSKITFSLNSLSLGLALVIYDMDLFFFFSESANLILNSPTELMFLALYMVIFCAGLWYDYTRLGYEWVS